MLGEVPVVHLRPLGAVGEIQQADPPGDVVGDQQPWGRGGVGGHGVRHGELLGCAGAVVLRWATGSGPSRSALYWK